MNKAVAQARLARLVELGLSCSSCTVSERVRQLRSRLTDRDLTRKRTEVLFSALGDETRLKMLELIADEELCACEIMASLELTQPTTSHHLGILERAGLVTSRRNGKWVFYALSNSRVRNIMGNGTELAKLSVAPQR